MTRPKWTEEQLIDLLGQLPNIIDNRNPDDIYQHLSFKINRKRKLGRIAFSLSGIAVICAAFILLIKLSPGFMLEQHYSTYDARQESNSKEHIENTNEIEIRIADDEMKQVGQLDRNANSEKGHSYFLLNDENQKQPNLVPIEEPLATIEDAIFKMQSEISMQGLKAPIPQEVQFEKVVSNGDKLIIFIKEGSIIPQSDELIQGIRAILLTAKEFGYKTVELKKNGLDQIGPFQLNQEIEVSVN